MVLFETGPQRDLVVLDDEDGWDTLHGGEVGAFVGRRGLGGTITNPREHHSGLALDLERQRDSRDHGHHVADMRDRLQHPV